MIWLKRSPDLNAFVTLKFVDPDHRHGALAQVVHVGILKRKRER
jgi:hypothetical protein